ncbi:hypothetical protein [Actinacidiphila glaucinigra]|uniref:Uncharacterized protein n=1 Tax=Actinacidiphila glaucinigra TaxID=235986 RepID=A0A239LTM6_9ACTN|nr:hypothetical protein [Actinacidiphila glaucinigra]SNT33228.1 hypothetical protein SAMN05216252_12130 [Actinacidiphila glaucinigra]
MRPLIAATEAGTLLVLGRLAGVFLGAVGLISLLLAVMMLNSARRDRAEGAAETVDRVKKNGFIGLTLGFVLIAVDAALWVL